MSGLDIFAWIVLIILVASVVAVFYALAAGRWIYRLLEWKMLPGILARSALMTASR